MKKNIGSIATIKTGYYCRPTPGGSVVYLQARYFDEHGALHHPLIPELDPNDINPKKYLVPGDILVTAKGTRLFAVVYDSSWGPCVASSTFLIVHLHDPTILPDYLALILTRQLSHPSPSISGGHMPSITIDALSTMMIALISQDQQQMMCDIYRQYLHHRSLLYSLDTAYQKLIDVALLSHHS